jgi:Tol biopolymer transport system component
MSESGRLMLVIDQELRIINTDGSVREVIIPREDFEKIFTSEFHILPFAEASPDGKKLLVLTCMDQMEGATHGGHICDDSQLFLSTTDLTQIKMYSPYGNGNLDWSPTSDKVLIQKPVDIEGRQVISAVGPNFGEVVQSFDASVAFWSFDGSQIYYYHQNNWYVVNSDGSDQHVLECALCSMAPEISSNAVAQSPDGKQLALAYKDGSVIITSPDFADFKMISFDNSVGYLSWSPDSKRLVVDMYQGANQSKTMILDANGSLIEELEYPGGSPFITVCGWSPDSKQIAYLAYFPSGYKLYLYETGTQKSVELLSFELKDERCPIWLPANP